MKFISFLKKKVDVTLHSSNYSPQFYFRTTDVTGAMKLPDGVEMVMPGDNTSFKVELSLQSRWKKVFVSRSVKVVEQLVLVQYQKLSNNFFNAI